MRRVIYREWVPAGRLMKALVGFISSVFFCILLVVIAIGSPLALFLIVILTSITAFLLFLFWNYRGIQIKVSSKKLLVHYGFFNRKIVLLADIVSCEPTRASFGKYGGVGVRYGIDGSWAYTTSLGDAVKINLRKGRPFVFSSNNPEEICSIIRKIKTIS